MCVVCVDVPVGLQGVSYTAVVAVIKAIRGHQREKKTDDEKSRPDTCIFSFVIFSVRGLNNLHLLCLYHYAPNAEERLKWLGKDTRNLHASENITRRTRSFLLRLPDHGPLTTRTYSCEKTCSVCRFLPLASYRTVGERGTMN